MYVFQLPNGRLINHITTGSLRMVFYTKELHHFTFEEWAESGGRISNDGPSYRATQAPPVIPYGLARLPSICHSETYQLSVTVLCLAAPVKFIVNRCTFSGNHAPSLASATTRCYKRF